MSDHRVDTLPSFIYDELINPVADNDKVGVAITDCAGEVLYSTSLFDNLLVQFQINSLQEHLRSPHIVFKSQAGILTLQQDYLQEVENEFVLWIAFKEVDEDTRKYIAAIKHIYYTFNNAGFEVVFRTSVTDQLVFYNRLLVKTFGFASSKQPEGYKITELCDADVINRIKQKVAVSGHVQNEVVTFRTLGGEKWIGLVNCHYFDGGENNPVLAWTVLDISERILYQESLRMNNIQLEKVNSQMEKFLYSTSHDLRSPLTSIFGLVNLARLESKEPVIQDYFSRIESSAMRLDNLIRDIISFSKTTYQTVKYDKVDVRSLIEKYLNSYKDNASFGTIEFEIITQCNEAVFSDPERLGVILDNLIRNAIHFFDPNKATSFVRISAASSKENVTIEIMDNGVGIPSQHLEKVFDMFYKASIHSKGAGLGLYIVKETVNTLNGNVSVESELGFGTIFRLVIPNKA